MGRLTRSDMQAHCAELVRRDVAFREIVKAAPLCPFGRVRPLTTHFESLVRAVIAQQVSTAAARTITSRMRELAGGDISAATLTALTPTQLQSAGLTGAKVRSLVELSQTAAGGGINFRRIARQSDDQIIAELTAIYGIGVWTAQMFLMFQLGRLDVWPTGDLAVRRGWDALHSVIPRRGHATSTQPRSRSTSAAQTHTPLVGAQSPGGVSARELDRLGEALTGIRSVASWYCWRAA